MNEIPTFNPNQSERPNLPEPMKLTGSWSNSADGPSHLADLSFPDIDADYVDPDGPVYLDENGEPPERHSFPRAGLPPV